MLSFTRYFLETRLLGVLRKQERLHVPAAGGQAVHDQVKRSDPLRLWERHYISPPVGMQSLSGEEKGLQRSRKQHEPPASGRFPDRLDGDGVEVESSNGAVTALRLDPAAGHGFCPAHLAVSILHQSQAHDEDYEANIKYGAILGRASRRPQSSMNSCSAKRPRTSSMISSRFY